MLVLSRRNNQRVVLPELGIAIVVVDIRGDKVRLGIEAPKGITIHRQEVQDAIERQLKHQTSSDEATEEATSEIETDSQAADAMAEAGENH